MPIPNNPSDAIVLRELHTKVELLIRDGQEQKDLIRELTRTVTKLAVIEERQTAGQQAMERAFAEIGRLDSRLKLLELAHPGNKAVKEGVNKLFWMVVSGLAGVIIATFIRSPMPTLTHNNVPAGAMPQLTIPAPK